MLQDYSNVLVLFSIVAVGFMMGRVKWFNADSNKALTKLLLNVTLPLTLILSITQDFSKKEFLKLLPNVILPAGVVLSLILLAYLTSLLIRVPKVDRGLFTSLCSMSSTVFFGIPVTLAIYSSHELPYALLTYIAQTVIYWTLGTSLLNANNKFDIVGTIKNIFTAPLIAFIIGIILLLNDVAIPSFLYNIFNYLSAMTAPMAMLIIGAIIYFTGLRNLRINFYIIMIIFFRFFVAPVVVLLLSYLISPPVMMTKVTILVCALPISNTTVILANKYKINVELATQSLSFSILFYLFYIPAILWFISYVPI